MDPNSCPHCKELLPLDLDPWKRSFGRMHHLLDHALLSAIGMHLKDIDDMNYADFVADPVPDEDAWETAVLNADRCLTDEMFPRLSDMSWMAEALEESGALGQSTANLYRHGNNMGKSMYMWFHERYPHLIEPWNASLERQSRTGSDGWISRS